jgi:FkbM family methyltransferase
MRAASLLARHWPFANGSGRIIDKFTKREDASPGEQIAQTSDGFPLHVNGDDLIGRHLLLSGKFDRSIVQVLLDHARPGDTLLDIGANIGYVSAVFLAKVKNSRAVCVEPQPGILDLLRKNMAQFDGRARVLGIGLADKDGSLRFLIKEWNRGASRISPDGNVEVPVMNSASALMDLPRVDLIKIDVEGFEEPIFRAARDQLRRLKPRAILFEDQNGSAAPAGSIGGLLSGLGYRIFGIDKRLLGTNLVRLDTSRDCRFNDYIAVL